MTLKSASSKPPSKSATTTTPPPRAGALFDLGLGPLALAFVAVSDKESIRQIERLEEQFGANWPEHWLKQEEVSYAEYA